MNFNRSILAGNLVADPEEKTLSKGNMLANLRLAVNEEFKSRDGSEQKRVLFMDVVAWGRQAETCAKFLKKGSPILVEGTLQMDSWEDKSGEKRSKVRLRADRVTFLPDGKSSKGDEVF